MIERHILRYATGIDTNMRRLIGLDGLRGIAVSMVVIAHAEQTTAHGYTGILWPLHLLGGDLGVHLFFVLSGFVITRMLLNEYARSETISYINFYIRRTKRIFPAFYSYVAVISILTAVGYLNISDSNLWAAGLYLWNYVDLLGIATAATNQPDGHWYLGHFWTLALEEQFYWFWPALFMLIMRKRNALILPALILIIPAIRIATYFAIPSVRGQLTAMAPTGIDSILVGCFFAMHQGKLETYFSRILNNRAALGLLTAIIFIALPLAHDAFRGYWTATYLRTGEAALIGVFLLALANDKPFILRGLFFSRPVQYLGMISYSLYIWQQLVMGEHNKWGLNFASAILVSIAFGTISYYGIERLFFARKSPVVSDAASA
jgi:peptidoglycan/LPS O-acetylase OafA/YrhL